MVITQVEAKAKLSQNRSDADQAGVVDGLREHPVAGAAEVADLMSQRFS
jgi:transcriptional regulator